MADEKFLFNFKFNLHKSCLPFGWEDDDLPRLSAAYGVDLEEMKAVAAADRAFNREEAALLCRNHPELTEKLKGRRIAFLGDSLTSDRCSYLNIIRAALAGSGAALLDHSVSGWRVLDIIVNLVPSVTDFKPDIAHIMIGSNDIRRSSDEKKFPMFDAVTYARDLDYLTDKLLENGVKLILSTIPPFDAEKIKAAFWNDNECYLEEDRAAFNEAVRAQARKEGCVLNDMEPVYARYSTAELTLDDGLHLNGTGHRLLTERVVRELLRAAGEREA